MLKELFEKQRRYTNYFFENLELEPIEKLTEILMQNQGTLFFTGVGKSGLVAKKIAFTMISTGTRAFYLTPTDALHGDLGMVSAQDTFILLSKSGESDELINLAPAIRNKGARLVGIVCNPNSRLASVCESVITLPFDRELCPFDMAPTMSTTNQLLFGDLLTIALMKRKNFSLDEYALNHPSGRIGKRMILKVEDVMLTNDAIPCCQPEDRLQDILVILSEKRCGCILIVDKKFKLLGIFTDGDLRRMLLKKGPQILDAPIKEIMTAQPQSISRKILAWDAMKRMEGDPKARITVLPVIDSNSKVEGILLLHDIIQKGL